MNGTIRDSEGVTIDAAVLLASSGVFDGAGDGDGAGAVAGRASVGPLTRVGGMTLVQRTLCALQRGGIARVSILVGEAEDALRSLVGGDGRIGMDLRWFSVLDYPPWRPRTWVTVTRDLRGSCLIVGGCLVFPPSLIAGLREEGREGKAIVTVGPPGEPGWDANPVVRWRFAPHELEGAGAVPRVALVNRDVSGPVSCAAGDEDEDEDGDGDGATSAVDLVVMPVRLFGTAAAGMATVTGAATGTGPGMATGTVTGTGMVTGAATGTGTSTGTGAGPVRLALERAAAEGAVRVVSASAHGYQDIRCPGGVRKAERLLFRLLHGGQDAMDGVVDRYVNRHLSRGCSWLFLRWGWSPHVVTALSMLVGLLGAACFAAGSYRAGVAGAVLFQCAVILDCCDGDVARLTFAESRFGRTLDLVADNVVHMAIFAGIAWGVYRAGGGDVGEIPLLLGVTAMAANGVALAGVSMLMRLVVSSGGGGADEGVMAGRGARPNSRMSTAVRRLATRDFSVVVMACACMGWLYGLLWLGAVGGGVFAVVVTWSVWRARAV